MRVLKPQQLDLDLPVRNSGLGVKARAMLAS